MSLYILGRAEEVDFPELQLSGVPARIDTGAKTSSVWASQLTEKDGELKFVLFAKSSPFYTGNVISTKSYSRRMVSSSMGTMQERYVVRLKIQLAGKKIRATFSLANRATQVYPVLVGRNILRGKFIVDVKQGKPLIKGEQARSKALQSRVQEEKS